jgi:hypothetical protein
LLWPPAADRHAARTTTLSAGTAHDLDLERIISAISAAHGYAPRTRQIVLNLCADPAVIRYRQDVLVDLVERPALAERLTGVLPDIFTLDSFVLGAQSDQSALHEVVWRIGQLESFVNCVHGLSAAFEDAIDDLRAEGLRSLASLVAGIRADEIFQNLVRDLPEMLEKVRGIASEPTRGCWRKFKPFMSAADIRMAVRVSMPNCGRRGSCVVVGAWHA